MFDLYTVSYICYHLISTFINLVEGIREHDWQWLYYIVNKVSYM